MAKINATYSSGYYLSPDTDFRRLQEQQTAEKRKLHKRSRDGEDDAETVKANTKRQTFAIPFDLYCDHCERRIPRGAHVYTNRRPTRIKYLNAIRIWELEIRCQYCSGLYYLHTDPETPKETGGYKCVKSCRRAEGDYLSLNKRNEAAKAQWEQEKAEADTNPLAALERENEASRELAERNRCIEEDVLERADADDDAVLLAAMRRRRRQEEEDDATHRGSLHDRYGLSTSKYTFDGADDADDVGGSDGQFHLTEKERAAEEAAYERFEAEMSARWQEARQTAAKQASLASSEGGGSNMGRSWFSGEGDDVGGDADALSSALARYGSGGVRGARPHPKKGGSGPSSSSTSSSSVPPSQNPFIASDNDSESEAEEGNERGRPVARPPPPPPSPSPSPAKVPSAAVKRRRGSLLSSMFADDGGS